jgi:MFS family permease
MAIAGEVIAGLSYGAQPLLHAVASEVVPRKYRPFAQASCNVAAALGGLVALLVGGAMTRDNYAEGFRDYWYLATALYAIAAILCVILYNPPARPSQLGLTHIEKLRKLDWIGYFLLTSGLVLFCVGLSWSQNPYLWTDAHVLATFLVGFFLLVAFGVYEWKFQADGMVHHGLFSHRNFAIALGGVFVEGLVFFAANNYFAFEVGVFFETDPLRTGLRYSISFIAYAISSVLAGIYCSKTKKLRLPTVLAFLSIIIFNICMATATPASSAAVWGFPIFLGIGLGVCLCALVTAAQLSTPRELISVTSGLMISIRSFGGSIGLAICKLFPAITRCYAPV